MPFVIPLLHQNMPRSHLYIIQCLKWDNIAFLDQTLLNKREFNFYLQIFFLNTFFQILLHPSSHFSQWMFISAPAKNVTWNKINCLQSMTPALTGIQLSSKTCQLSCMSVPQSPTPTVCNFWGFLNKNTAMDICALKSSNQYHQINHGYVFMYSFLGHIHSCFNTVFIISST